MSWTQRQRMLDRLSKDPRLFVKAAFLEEDLVRLNYSLSKPFSRVVVDSVSRLNHMFEPALERLRRTLAQPAMKRSFDSWIAEQAEVDEALRALSTEEQLT